MLSVERSPVWVGRRLRKCLPRCRGGKVCAVVSVTPGSSKPPGPSSSCRKHGKHARDRKSAHSFGCDLDYALPNAAHAIDCRPGEDRTVASGKEAAGYERNMAASMDDTARMMKLADDLVKLHQEYQEKLQPAFSATLIQQKAIQKSEEFCERQVKHLLHHIRPLRTQLAKLKLSSDAREDDQKNEAFAKAVQKLDVHAAELESTVNLIKRNLPCPSGKYLYLVLGSVRVSMPNNRMKLNYKIEYENFKLVVTWALLAIAIVCLLLGPGSHWDPVLMFGRVWFYCTLTIRESILKANGSNINGWWRIYHFLATGLSGVTVLWADKEGFQTHLRDCFLAYTCVMMIAHQMQYRYQAGTLYRLQALGAQHENSNMNPMEVTVEGVRSMLAGPMYRDFFLLVPFLYAVYLLQLLMLYLVVEMITSKPELATWHAVVAAVFFGVMFVGNVLTTSTAIYSKCKAFLPDPLYLVRRFA